MLHGFLKLTNLTDISAPLREVISIFKRPFFRHVATKKFKKYINTFGGIVNIELGAGDRKGENGWITVDISNDCDIYWDLRWSLPFPSNSVTMIYSSHVLEHFYYKDLIKIMEECHRILKPGGGFSICVPDAKIYIDGYIDNHFDSEYFLQYKPAVIGLSKIDIINYVAYMNGHHKHMFDIAELTALLKMSGFISVKQRGYDPILDLAIRKYESIYAIGFKQK